MPNLGPVPIHMALAINGGPSPSSVLTAASLFPFQTAHMSTFQHWFSILPGNIIRKGFLSSTTHYSQSTIHHPLSTKHNIPMQGCNSTTPMMLSSLSKVPHPPCSSTLKVRLGPRHQVYPHSAQDQGLSQILTIRLSLSFGW